jgi:hypothetical protein
MDHATGFFFLKEIGYGGAQRRGQLVQRGNRWRIRAPLNETDGVDREPAALRKRAQRESFFLPNLA